MSTPIIPLSKTTPRPITLKTLERHPTVEQHRSIIIKPLDYHNQNRFYQNNLNLPKSHISQLNDIISNIHIKWSVSNISAGCNSKDNFFLPFES